MDPTAAALPRRPRFSGAVQRIATASTPYIAAGIISLLSATLGFVAAVAFLPGKVRAAQQDITQIRSEIGQLKQVDSALASGLSRIHADVARVSAKLDANQRLQCIDAREKALAGDRALQLQLDAAEIPCAELLGNRIRQ